MRERDNSYDACFTVFLPESLKWRSLKSKSRELLACDAESILYDLSLACELRTGKV